MIFLFVDHVVELSRNSRIVTTRQITSAEEIFTQHFPGRPMMPASLQIESLAQSASILLETSSGFQCKAYVGFVTNAKFRHPVVPGFEMRVEVEVEHLSDGGAVIAGSVLQRDRRCANVEIGMVMTPIAEFFTSQYLPSYHALYDVWLAETRLSGFDEDPREGLQRATK